MDSLSETQWDVLIEGTSLQQSLLALALSRSDKKILHIDQNRYYGGDGAAFTLQETYKWIVEVNDGALPSFERASTWESGSDKLSFSRAYTLTLSPQIIYTRSELLTQLVSSKVYRQLEFQAVSNWWIYEESNEGGESALNRLPNGREDIFQDDSINNRAKRSLMRFLKFVIDYDNQKEIWQPFACTSLPDFLSSQFKLPPNLQTIILALTLSLASAERTTVQYALPRIARHLTSIGVFGPGFGAVVPKWGGGAEIAQVACRSGAVGGGVYVLGTAVQASSDEDELKAVELSNGETVETRHLIRNQSPNTRKDVSVSKSIAVVASRLPFLFVSSVEGAPTPAVSVVVFPENALSVDSSRNSHPIYIMVHSGETGECPIEQCVLYASTSRTPTSDAFLSCAINVFLSTVPDSGSESIPEILFKLAYTQYATDTTQDITSSPALDLAFNDQVLRNVEASWSAIMGHRESNVPSDFMNFEERKGQYDEDDG